MLVKARDEEPTWVSVRAAIRLTRVSAARMASLAVKGHVRALVVNGKRTKYALEDLKRYGRTPPIARAGGRGAGA